MKRATLVLFCALLAWSCRQADAPAPDAPAQTKSAEPEDFVPAALEDANLLNIARGVAVVSRTGEASLVNSAAHAVDGMHDTFWWSPPEAPAQTIVYALAAPTRIDKVGATTLASESQTPARIRFEASRDGRSWRELATFAPTENTQLLPAKPAEALFLRVSTLEAADRSAAIHSFRAAGEETAPAAPRSFGGCWEINGFPSQIAERGGRITGVIGGERPTYLDGGVDGRVARVMWQRGPMWGFALLTATPDGSALTGLPLHEEPQSSHHGFAWFGRRCAARITPPRVREDLPRELLNRAGRWAMFGLAFGEDDTLINDRSATTIEDAAQLIAANRSRRLRIVAHEFRGRDAAENRRRATARIDALRNALTERGTDLSRVEFVGSGSDRTTIRWRFATERLLASRIDLETLP